jgi:phosphoribosyl-dephospho-CoA transferase
MELRVNDLLRVNSVKNLNGDFSHASWVLEAVARAPYAVVRRAPLINCFIPVGIRGSDRSQRMAASVLWDHVEEVITPEQLVKSRLWRNNEHIRETSMFHALERIESILKPYGILWGPVGSVGFELACNVPVVTKTSDLDLVLRTPSPLLIEDAKDIQKQILAVPVKTDIQMETPNGSVALEEYQRGRDMVLRTLDGPKLVDNPWSLEEVLEV